MEITDKMEHVRDQLRQHRADEKLDHLQRENLRLETETRMLRGERDDERGDFAKLMESLERGSKAAPRHRVRRLITLTSVALGAYVVGAKAGRERYDEIRAFVQKAMGSGRSTLDRARERTDDAIESALVASERVSDAGQVIGETVKTVAEGREAPAVGGASSSRTA
jgi:hypothetical protein